MKFNKRHFIIAIALVTSMTFFSAKLVAQITSPPSPKFNPVPVLCLLFLCGDDFAVEDDVLNVTVATVSTSLNVLSNDSTPNSAALVSFGGPEQTNSGDNAIGATFTTASGAQATLTADGQLRYDATTISSMTPGTDVLFYEVENGTEQEIAKITINFGDAATAQDDPSIKTFFSDDIVVSSANGLSSNDFLGAPEAAITSFGGGDLGGTISSNTANASVPFDAISGNLQVNADGSFSLTGEPFTVGVFTFDYRLTNIHGESDATVTLTVDPHPSAVDDTAQINEDDPATTIDVMDNDTDTNKLSKIDSITLAANGTVTITNDGADLSYEANKDYCNDGEPTDDFTYTLTPGGSTGSVEVTVDCVNDEPFFTKGADQTLVEDAGEQTIADWASDISAGPADESGQTVSFNVKGNTEPGLFSAGPAVDSSGTLTYTPAANANGSATITIEAQDDGGIADGGVDTSASQTFVINVTAVNDAPEITSNGGGATAAINVAENSTAVTDVDSFDAEGETEFGGGLGYGHSGDDASQFNINAGGILTFRSPPNFENPGDNDANGIYNVTVTVTDSGGVLTDSQDLAITVTDVAGGNITILKNIVGGGFADMDFNFTFAGSPFAISQNDGGGFTQIDIPPGTYNVTESVPTAWSLSSIECGVDQNNTGATNGINIVLEANENVVCTFNNTPDPGSIVIVLDTNPKAAQDFAFTTTGGLMPPSFSLDDDTDGTLPNTQSFSSVTPGDYSVSQTLVANYNLTLTCNDPTTNTLVAGTTASIAVAPGETVTCTFTNTFASPPVAEDDSYTATGNIGIDIADGTNDVLEQGSDDTLNGASITTFGATGNETQVGNAGTSAQGGSVTLNANGSFIYEPAAGFVGPDTFIYTLESPGGSSDATVTIDVSNVIWFINNVGGGSNSGTFTNPFQTISAFNAFANSSTAGALIALASGDYNENDGINLQNNQTLLGRGVALSTYFTADDNSPQAYKTYADTAAARPTISPSGGAGNNGIDLASGNTIRGLNIGDRQGAIAVKDNGASAGTVTISNMSILGLGAGIEIDNGGTLAINLDEFHATGSTTDEGIHLANVTGDFDINTLGANIISTQGQPAIVIDGSSSLDLNVTLTSVSSLAGANTGISIEDTTGSFTVTGGGTAGSGGTISGKTGSNGSTTSGIGIYLNNALNVEFNDMQLNSFSNYAILGTGLVNLTLADMVVNGESGNDVAFGEGAVKLQNISGNVNVTNGSYGGARVDNFDISNSSATMTATFSGVTINANNAAEGANGVHLTTSGIATATLNVNGSTFTASRRSMILVEIGGTGGGTVNIGNTLANSFTQNQSPDNSGISSTHPGAIHIKANGNGTGNVTTTISDNTILAGAFTFKGDVIDVENLASYSGIHKATISGNTIGTLGDNGSAVDPNHNQFDTAIEVDAKGPGTMIGLIANNSVFDYNDSGIEALFAGDATYDLTITNNHVSDGLGTESARAAIFAFGADFGDTCIQIDGNFLNDPTNDEMVIDVLDAPYRDPGLVTLNDQGLKDHLLATNLGSGSYTALVFTDGVAGGGACAQP